MKNGAGINQTDERRGTALIHAARHGNAEIAYCLQVITIMGILYLRLKVPFPNPKSLRLLG